ncbi:MAG: beta,beta-carotene 9,10-dioxygenase [Thermoleophilaceae bacterium]|jgi:carotenoid cleavage dioxygenase-like enzyme|nr:beta,beta-carotene 9,10-dioxygenase [Thermoleophilaceae bacterium]
MLQQTSVGSRATAGFADLDEELTLDQIPLKGELPPWLSGSLVRVTPARFDIDGERPIRHWFDGLAMLHRFAFSEGRVSYANRFLQSDSYKRAERGDGIGTGFATDPCRAIFKRVQAMFSPDFTDNANVNLMRLGERYVAMTESPLPVEFDAETLATLGHTKPAPGQITTAHPHFDSARGEAVNYAARVGPRSSYRVYTTDAQDNQRVTAKVPVKEPAYMHSFGMTERYVVLAEFPLLLNPLKLAAGKRTFIESYRWRPERGTRFLVIDRQDGGVKMTVTAEPFFSFHHVNAWEEGDDVVVDLVAYEDASVIDELYIDRLRAGTTAAESQLRRYRLSPGQERVDGEVLLDRTLELPRIDYSRVNAKPHRIVYAAGARPEAEDWLDELLKFDVETRALRTWHEPGCYPGEPVFVGRPDREREDDGAILSVVFDSSTGRSFLLVLDAATFEEQARAEVPHHVPFSFHGQFMRGA